MDRNITDKVKKTSAFSRCHNPKICNINPATSPHTRVASRIFVLSLKSGLTLYSMIMPVPALTSRPAHTAENGITPSTYIVVRMMLEAQLGIRPVSPQNRTDCDE